MDNKVEVIGIDHGWSGMKTVHEVFTSGCKEISTEPAFTENLLEFGGKYYKIGSKRLEVKDTKVTDENYYMLTLAAVAKELKIRGKRTAHVLLAVGLPLTRFGDEKKDFVSYLSKKKEVSFTFEKENYRIFIENVCVYPQCYAAVIDRIDKFLEKQLVVDIGSWTVDIMPIINHLPDESVCVTQPHGIITCIQQIDKVRPGGIVAVITTKGTMDKKNNSVRKYLAERAELVGAVRLPNSAFKAEAGTEVTSDILFFQKRERKISAESGWVHLGMTENGVPVNSYFVEHPEMMLGHMEYDTGRYGSDSGYTVCVNEEEDFDLYGALQQAVSRLSVQIPDYEVLQEEEPEESIPADPDVKNYTYTFVDGTLYYRKDSRMYRQEVGNTVLDRIRGMDEIRKYTRYLIDIQLNGCSEEGQKAAQGELNAVYDRYIKKYGYITSQGNSRVFRDDEDYPLLCSLENVDEERIVTKADMFTKQTIRARKETDHAETAVEALNLSVCEYNGVNLSYMLEIYEPDISGQVEKLREAQEGSRRAENNLQQSQAESAHPKEVILSEDDKKELKRAKLVEELKGIIFLNPQKYLEHDKNQGWETADEYLSGNVRDKLRVAKAAAGEHPELFGNNVAALEQVQPQELDAREIDVRIGTTWIEPEDYEGFLYETLHTPERAQARRYAYGTSGIQVQLNKFQMEWFVENKSLDKTSVAVTKTYGTSRMDAYTIFENTLNLRTVTVKDRIEEDGGRYHYETNQKETMLAREKQNQLKEAFREWIFAEPERRNKYVRYYNETFNNVRLREYDGSHLQFPGMNPDIRLKQHQRNAIARVLMGGNTLLAHCVGAGKSFEMMAACMEQKRLGLANKTAMVVPKPLIGQTASEFLRLYPSANILVATERDFEKKGGNSSSLALLPGTMTA